MEIRPKKFKFNFDRHWFDGNPLKTYFWNANSILFEQNEYIFCKLLSFYKKKIDDVELLKEIDILFGQESWHSHNHKSFNDQISKHYDISKVLTDARLLSGRVLTLSNSKKLSYAVSFETMIVKICKLLLKEKFLKTDKEARDFWIWHTQEEIEHGYIGHKLYDYFKFSRILNKIHLLHLTYMYCKFIISSMLEFYKQDRNLNFVKGTT